jgi:hypothetical protein
VGRVEETLDRRRGDRSSRRESRGARARARIAHCRDLDVVAHTRDAQRRRDQGDARGRTRLREEDDARATHERIVGDDRVADKSSR